MCVWSVENAARLIWRILLQILIFMIWLFIYIERLKIAYGYVCLCKSTYITYTKTAQNYTHINGGLRVNLRGDLFDLFDFHPNILAFQVFACVFDFIYAHNHMCWPQHYTTMRERGAVYIEPVRIYKLYIKCVIIITTCLCQYIVWLMGLSKKEKET